MFMLFALIALGVSATCGLICVVNRLWDFRGTARRARNHPGAPAKEHLDGLGKRSWALFYMQWAAFFVGILFFAAALLARYRGNLTDQPVTNTIVIGSQQIPPTPSGDSITQWVLVVVTAVTAAFICWQAVETRRSARSAAMNAKAALLNAQAFLDSERPWLVVTVEKNEALPGRTYYFFRITNRGNTPATFVSGGFAHAFNISPNDLPSPPAYEPFIAPNNRFLPPGDGFNIQRTYDDLTKGIDPVALISSRAQQLGTADANSLLFFYGNIVYDDVLGRDRPGYVPHETRWCFAFFPAGLRFIKTGPDGSTEYNRDT